MADGEVSGTLSRRGFLTAGAALGGGLMIGFRVEDALAQGAAKHLDYFAPNAFVQVGRDGMVSVRLPKSEMGQGIATTIAMLVAEELEVDLDQVKVVFAGADPKLAVEGINQNTGGSTSVRQTWTPLRKAGATARLMIVAAAAKQWNVAAETCSAAKCQVIHVSSGRKFDYGQLVDIAATLPVPETVALNPVGKMRLIGQPLHRIEGPGKVNGTAVYSIDVKLPGMKVATLTASPVQGGKLVSVDEAPAMAVKGVVKVVKEKDFVAVVADHMAAAKKGLLALKPVWDDGPNGALSQADVVKTIEDAALRPGAVMKAEGDIASGLAAPGVKRVSAVYRTPFLAHTPMEPMNCTVQIKDGKADVWVGTQSPPSDQDAVSKALGLPLDAVTVHNHVLGGGFGRRSEADVPTRAALISKAMGGTPVKVIWTREEDVHQDFYQPYTVNRMEAALNDKGEPTAWRHKLACGSVFARRIGPLKDGQDRNASEGASELIYHVPNFQMTFQQQETVLPIGFWRGVGPSHNVFVVESFMDELAHAAGKDPVAYRLEHIKAPRAAGVLKLAAEKAEWGKPLPKGQGWGVSVFFGFGSYLATASLVEVMDDGSLKVHRVISAIDCGVPINPRNIEAQMFGGATYGLTALLYGEITIDKGRVVQGNFHNYPPLRMKDAPRFETHIVQSTESPGGLGETSTAGVAASVTNAVFAATGTRMREFPLANFNLKTGQRLA